MCSKNGLLSQEVFSIPKDTITFQVTIILNIGGTISNTVVYYTSNQEKPEFEAKIIENLKKQAGDIPIISVSQKPIKLGKNICVGKLPISYKSSFRQLLRGLKEATSEFCIAAEADTLYPPEYFTFTPPTDNVYRYTNLYVYFQGYDGFWRKRYVEAAQMCNRKVWIKNLERVLKSDSVNPPFVFTTKDKYSWTGKNPVLTFKTRKGIGFKTGFISGSVRKLPYWGSSGKIKEFL